MDKKIAKTIMFFTINISTRILNEMVPCLYITLFSSKWAAVSHLLML